MTNDRFGNAPDDLAARLRRALHEEASMTRPAGDGLSKIRAGIEEKRAGAWWRPAALAVAAAGGAGLIAGVVLFGGGNGDGTNTIANPTMTRNATTSESGPSSEHPAGTTEGGDPSSGETATDPATGESVGEPSTGEGSEPSGGQSTVVSDPGMTPAESPSTSPSGTGSTSVPVDGETVTVPVYYLGDDGGELRLYREFHRTPLVESSTAVTALRQMFAGSAADPDYTSVWPESTEVLSYAVADGTATVDLTGAAGTATDAGSDAEAKSVQQLVYTVTAADDTVERVRLLVEGQEVTDLWGHGAVGEQPLTRAPRIDVEALVWITPFTDGQTVDSPLEFGGIASAFEATVSWEVLRDGAVVENGFATAAEAGPARAQWSASVSLPPGTYSLRAFLSDQSGGESGRPEPQDTKTFTVR
jgi:hypothetical protein